MVEEWRDIPGYEGWYQAGSYGNIRRVRKARNTFIGRMLKISPNAKTGYVRVRLYKHNQGRYLLVHRLVCEAFHGPCPPGYTTNHKDGNRSNNRADNLEWASYSENLQHAYDVLDRPRNTGESHGMSRFQPEDVLKMRELVDTGQLTVGEVARIWNTHPGTISQIVRRKRWKHI